VGVGRCVGLQSREKVEVVAVVNPFELFMGSGWVRKSGTQWDPTPPPSARSPTLTKKEEEEEGRFNLFGNYFNPSFLFFSTLF
jgi:hypothetical protein